MNNGYQWFDGMKYFLEKAKNKTSNYTLEELANNSRENKAPIILAYIDSVIENIEVEEGK